MEFVLELAAPDGLPPGAVPKGIPRLHHEALDDPVEDQVVEVAVLAVRHEVLHRARALLRVQPQVQVAVVGVHDLRWEGGEGMSGKFGSDSPYEAQPRR